MRRIEETTGAPLPVSLRAFWEVVGGINFVWDYERGDAPDLGVDLPMDDMDPLSVDAPEEVTRLASTGKDSCIMARIKNTNRNPGSAAMRLSLMDVACFSIASFLVNPTQAGEEVIASKSLTVQSSGPRAGDAGSKYFNIQGKDNEKYASFGVLVFDIPKDIQDKKLKNLTLTLVQSVPKFAKDGTIRFFLAPDLDTTRDLKFDATAPDGVGSQIKSLHPLGQGNFKKIETGKAESFSLTVDETAWGQVARGGKLCLVIVPADGVVAATYFGASETDKEKSPKLTLDPP